jgi:MFS family permease
VTVRLGLRENAAQFSLLVGLNALVGAMVGLERSVLPLVGERDFGLASKTAILSFLVAFGLAKAFANLAAGRLATRVGRKRLLVLGWLLAAPVPLLIAFAPSWGWIVAANVILGANQGLAWSMTVFMKIDLAGPVRRGLAVGLNESAGYLGVAATAFATGALAATFAPRTLVWAGAAVIAAIGLLVSIVFVRDTEPHVEREQAGETTARRGPGLAAASQAGLVNNLNDALAWGLAPLYLAAHGAGHGQIAAVAAVYPAVWGAGQLGAGWLGDVVGRSPLVVAGMLVQAGGLAVLVLGDGRFGPALAAAVLLGVGTALVYPTLIAAVSDAVEPRERAGALGAYRFWRDSGLVVGAVLAGTVADAAGAGTAIAAVAGLTAASGLAYAMAVFRQRRHRVTTADLLARARSRIAPRMTPEEAAEAMGRGAVLVDIRSADDRRRDGAVPGSVHVPRSVLEWRADPSSGFANPHLGDLERTLVVFCNEGFTSSLAAAVLRELGCRDATDMIGGFASWKAAGLPVRPPAEQDPSGLAGMGDPEPVIGDADERDRQIDVDAPSASS